jgi:GrpB-like predicted nucleotidyltransferase (UPF0157 family)
LASAAVAVEHIGSTAVPGLLAKPIVDLMVGLQEYPPSAEVLRCLQELGYEWLGEAGVNGRTYLRLRKSTAFNLHLVQHAGHHWNVNLALRAYLAGSASARQRYAAAKESAIAAGAHTLLAYSASKAETVQALVHEALRANSDA